MRNAFRSLTKDFRSSRSFSTSLLRKPYSREDEHTFYNFTSGTWLYNREAQFSIRRLKFNVDALIVQCVKAGNATACTTFKKLAEGTSNRVFLAKLDNGKDVVARLPFPVAGPTRLATASEVATLEFARLWLDTPVPRVLDYCIDASATDVGAEFIIMDKVPGVELSSRWNDDVSFDDFTDLIFRLAARERKWADTSLPHIGSLYLARDLPGTIRSLTLPNDVPQHAQWGHFVIGPSVARKFWRGARARLDVDRGPWNDMRSQINAAINCEIKWLKEVARPYPPHSPFYRNIPENSPATHIDLLQRCLQILPFLPDLPEYSKFCLWHPDLNASNILIDNSGPLTPRYYLDWQLSTVDTLLDISSPPFLNYKGGKYILAVPGPEDPPPPLPAGFDQLPEAEQLVAKKERQLAMRSAYYHHATRHLNPALHAARVSPWQAWYRTLLEYPQHTWEDGVAPLKQVLIEICDAWDEIAPGTTCPISFDPVEVLNNESRLWGWKAELAAENLRSEIGLGPDGWVEENKLEEAKRRNREVLEQSVAVLHHEDDKAYLRRRWPFQDGARSWSAESCR